MVDDRLNGQMEERGLFAIYIAVAMVNRISRLLLSRFLAIEPGYHSGPYTLRHGSLF